MYFLPYNKNGLLGLKQHHMGIMLIDETPW